MGILDWIEEKARKKMRFSQIQISFQNIFAAVFLCDAYPFDKETLKACAVIRERALGLTAKVANENMLEDAASADVFEDNKRLKGLYASLSLAEDGAKRVDFAEQFRPESGWKRFSEDDWRAVLDGLKS